jgi:hypothetical protein
MRLLLLCGLALAACAAGQKAAPLLGEDGGDRLDLSGVVDDQGGGRPDLLGADLSGDCNVKMNEVQTGGATSATDEFIEIYNPCETTVTITGYKLVYRAAASANEGTIATLNGMLIPGGFYLVANSGFAGSADIKPYTGNITGLAATGGAIGIRDASGLLLDSVGWGMASNALVEGMPAVAPAGGRSIARHPDGADTDHNSTDFTDSTPTPKASN